MQRKAADVSSSSTRASSAAPGPSPGPGPSAGPAAPRPGCCQRTIGHITFLLNARGISTGYSCLRAGTPVRFRNLSQTAHTIDTRPFNLLSGMPTVIQPGGRLTVLVTRTPHLISGSIYVSRTVHDVTVCP